MPPRGIAAAEKEGGGVRSLSASLSQIKERRDLGKYYRNARGGKERGKPSI